ncbi:hypothetical protein [uncultured Cohaesibacter sp.]|uniref:hypothetical protein n=1 Tax=uncultured Cohaesibacter sp. TaxID=1002546 RepID=UPI00292E65C2|nr:hypothetical protein [uncultured Cohaesibacter sp.]
MIFKTLGMIRIAHEAETGGTPAPEATAPETPAEPTPETPAPDAEQSTDEAEGTPAPDGGADQGDENIEPDVIEAFKIDVPKGNEIFNDDVKAFETSFADWSKEHPDATAREALQWAAGQQMERAKAAHDEQMKKADEFATERNANVDKWTEALKADPQFGGEKLGETTALAMKAVEHAGDDGKLLGLLEQSGYGSNPVVIKALALYAQKFLAESPAKQNVGGKGRKNFSNAIYGDK